MKKLFTIIAVSCIFYSVQATNYYWVNGSGNWSDYGQHWANSSGGSVFHVQPPTPSDDVFFDANSFAVAWDTLWLDSTILNCKNLDFTGIANSVTIRSTYSSSGLNLYGSFLNSNIVNWNSISFDFRSNATGNNINPAGASFTGSFHFNGTGSWSLLGNLILTGSFYRSAGTFYSNGFNITAGNLYFSQSATSYLSTSVINCDSWHGSSSLLLDADSTVITANYFSGGDGIVYNDVFATYEIRSSNNCSFHDVTAGEISYVTNCTFHNVVANLIDAMLCTFNKVTFNYSARIYNDNYISSNTFDSLIFNNAGMIILISDTVIVNNFIQLGGTCSQLTELSGGGFINYLGPVITVDYLMLHDISVTGSSITANNSFDAGNVSGITINAPPVTPLYWVGGTGNWNDQTHWSTTSGGAGGACVPTPSNDVFIDANSFLSAGDTIYMNATAYCKTFDCSAVANNPVFNFGSYLNIYGSFLNSNIVHWNSISFDFRSNSTGNSIDPAGISFTGSFHFNGTGSWSLLGDLILTGSFYRSAGTFYSNGFNITAGNIYFSQSATSYLSTSVINCDSWHGSSSLLLDADSTVITANYFSGGDGIVYNDVFATYEIRSSNNCSFHDVTAGEISYVTNCTFHNVVANLIDAMLCTFNKVTFNYSARIYNDNYISSNTFDSLIFNNAGMIILISDTVIVNNFIQLGGTCSQLTELSGGGFINYLGPAITVDYLMLHDISVTGSSITANNSFDAGNVSGITINAPPVTPLYWVGGTGNWNDQSHWSTVSGGTGGACVPTPSNDVFIDANSFLTAGDTIYMNATAYCKTFDCSSVSNNPVFNFGSPLNIYGSFLNSNTVTLNANNFDFRSAVTGNTIDPAGASLTGSFHFNGTGSWSLLGDLILTGSFYRSAGTFYSNGFNITAGNIYFTQSATSYLSTSVINCDSWHGSSSLLLDADSTVITANYFGGGDGIVYNDVFATNEISSSNNCSFHDVTTGEISYATNCTFHNVIVNLIDAMLCTFNKVTFNNSARIYNDNYISSNTFDSLIFNNAGMTILISDTVIVNNYLYVNSDPAYPTSINGSGVILYNDTFCNDFLYIQNSNVIGGPFFAGDHSVDLGGNTGWIFASCSPVFSNVWPGDANYDLVVDNIDLLYMGVAFGDTGYVRPNASLNFTAQPCQDWFFQFINGTNIKKADSDGNGTIDFPDTTAVSLNYGLTHPFRVAAHNNLNTTGTDLILQLPGGQIAPGSQVSVPIVFGTPANIANNVHGLAFTINYDPSKIQSGSVSVDFTSSWIENTNNHLSIVKDFPSTGNCDVAFTRIDHVDVSGQGIIGYLNFTVATNSIGYLNFSFSNILAISHNEIEIPVAAYTDSAFTNVNEFTNDRFVIYPNPSTGNSMLYFLNESHETIEVQLTNMQGKIIYTSFTHENQFLLERNGLANGIYFISIRNDHNEIINRKIVLQ